MGYWITLKRGQESAGFSADTAEQALAAVEAKKREGWSEVRIIDPDGIETCAFYLRVAIDAVDVGAGELQLVH